MSGVNIPGQPYSPLGTILPIAGGIVGGIVGGGPAGSIAGAKLGQAVAGSGQGKTPGAVQGAGDALGRRLQAQSDDPQIQLAQAGAALNQLPPEYQQQYGPTIAAAQQRAAQGGV